MMPAVMMPYIVAMMPMVSFVSYHVAPLCLARMRNGPSVIGCCCPVVCTGLFWLAAQKIAGHLVPFNSFIVQVVFYHRSFMGCRLGHGCCANHQRCQQNKYAFHIQVIK